LSVPTVYLEPKGLPVLEALACGVPVVQPAHGAFPETLQMTGGGRLVPPNDASALADAWAELLLDAEARKRLGEAGQAAVWSRFRAVDMARETLKILERKV
jgi:glycosyltransferase involved in cell wall biosynthesis